MSGPLFDTLFRPTVDPQDRATGPTAGRGDRASGLDPQQARQVASAPPVRAAGTHTRAGNAMARTRTALLVGAARAVEASGTKITMSQVAAGAGVAKATLYNHFRTRDAVLAALAQDQVAAIVEAQDGKPLETALADAACAIADSPVRRGLARLDPAALAEVGRIDTTAPAWQVAHAGVAAALEAGGCAGTDTVLRWLASFVVSPAPAATIAADAAVLVAGLPRVVASEAAADSAAGVQSRSA